MTRPVAFFDFDGTLTRGDSLLPFLRMLAGTPRYIAKMAVLTPVLVAYATKLLSNDVAKQIVLTRFLRGMNVEELQVAGRKFASEFLPDITCKEGIERFNWHRSQGHLCVLVSASLDLYLVPWAMKTGFDDWITSGLETDETGSVTGRLRGGNCFGEKKVERIKTWLAGKKCKIAYAYGDSKGDLPMLRFANKGYLRKGNQFVLIEPDSVLD